MFYCAKIKSRIEQFLIDCRKLFVFALVLPYFALRLVKKKQRHFLNQSKVKAKPNFIPTCSQSFRAWRRLHVFACPSDWFIALFVCVVIGQSNCFCFAITTLKKTALTRDTNLLTDSKESIKKKLHISHDET